MGEVEPVLENAQQDDPLAYGLRPMRVRKNLASNKAWLAAGAGAIAIGIALMAKATRGK